jgi:hypothetical protein
MAGSIGCDLADDPAPGPITTDRDFRRTAGEVRQPMLSVALPTPSAKKFWRARERLDDAHQQGETAVASAERAEAA